MWPVNSIAIGRCSPRQFRFLLLSLCTGGLACGNGDESALQNDGGETATDAMPDEGAATDVVAEEDSGVGSEAAGLGSPCDILTDAGAAQGGFDPNAIECPSRLCLKPVVQQGAAGSVSTGAYCATACSQDSDCAGETRDPENPLDTRCSRGFACGVAFVKGKLCCQKLCLCLDFLGSAGVPTPIACQGAAAATCDQ